MENEYRLLGWISPEELEEALSSKYPIGKNIEADTRWGKTEGKIIGYTMNNDDDGKYIKAVKVDGVRNGENGEYNVSVLDIINVYSKGGMIHSALTFLNKKVTGKELFNF